MKGFLFFAAAAALTGFASARATFLILSGGDPTFAAALVGVSVFAFLVSLSMLSSKD